MPYGVAVRESPSRARWCTSRCQDRCIGAAGETMARIAWTVAQEHDDKGCWKQQPHENIYS